MPDRELDLLLGPWEYGNQTAGGEMDGCAPQWQLPGALRALSQLYSSKRICPATECYYLQPSSLEFSA